MRSTPADAGKTKPTDGHILRKQDHPRRCGENRRPLPKIGGLIGSPPRMRGKHRATVNKAIKAGITPADAGKTRYPFGRDGDGQDHPRGCGENFGGVSARRTKLGSPPRMRGKPVHSP